eukprot:scaffold30443_cov137-Skeletonema_menzelii.AAC.2
MNSREARQDEVASRNRGPRCREYGQNNQEKGKGNREKAKKPMRRTVIDEQACCREPRSRTKPTNEGKCAEKSIL